MSGFANATSITEFKVGMWIRRTNDNNGWNVVCSITPQGSAQLVNCGYYVRQSDIRDYDLNLDSIWVGREYQSRANHNHTVSVIMVSDTHVAFAGLGHGHLRDVLTRASFILNYVPLPVPASEQPASIQAGKPEPAAEWKPEAGKECLRKQDRAEPQIVFVVATHNGQSWVITPFERNNPEYHGAVVYNWELRPIPAEPPVKPCPHCGGPAELIPLGDGLMAYGCKDRCQHRHSITQGVALKHWNQRVEVPE